MNREMSIVLNTVLIAMGAAILMSSHSIFGLRGVAYMALGSYLLYRRLK